MRVMLVGTRGHLHNRVRGHKQQCSAIAKHYKNIQGTTLQFRSAQGMRKQIWLFSVWNAFYKSFKGQISTCNQTPFVRSIFVIFAPWYVNSSRQKSNLHDLIYFFFIMESWLLWNIGFYRSILPFYISRFTRKKGTFFTPTFVNNDWFWNFINHIKAQPCVAGIFAFAFFLFSAAKIKGCVPPNTGLI